MKFISAEEFLKQPKEMQKVITDWWQPSEGDLYCTRDNYDVIDVIVGITHNCVCGLEKDFLGQCNPINDDLIPLLTEGQLRQFIEEKTKDKYDILYSLKTKENVGFYKYTENETQPTYEVETHDLLQAYWKVATEIASKEINLEMNRHS